MKSTQPNVWKEALRSGLLGGAIALLLSLIGMVQAFSQRDVIYKVFTMGQVLFLFPLFFFSYLAVRRSGTQSRGSTLVIGVLSGLSGSAVLAALVLIGEAINLRVMLINASPALFEILRFKLPHPTGVILTLLVGVIAGIISAGIFLLPARIRKTLLNALFWMVMIGVLRDLILTVITRWGAISYAFIWLFGYSGLSPLGAIAVFIIVGALTYWRYGKPKLAIVRTPANKKGGRWITIAITLGLLIILPPVLGLFFAEILDNVGLYILMGLGLNIVVGFAGLLDLGYVAFYAIGAYTMGVLTSPELAANPLTYWQALPVALLVAVLSGIILGLPVLRMRGDYLAIVTLGFGEIVRLLVLSDWLRPWLGGSQGIQKIAVPHLGPLVLDTQQDLYYMILVGIGIVAFFAYRLKDSRLGRSWMALREDEDVAQAMGINLVMTKLSAFAVGALFSGLSGTIFAAKLTSAYAHSFSFMVSISVLSLIIIGGMGSIPGVVVGSLALIGLPDLLREFAEYRLLVYGAALVAMMILKPEGLAPEERRSLELHEMEETTPTNEATEVVATVE